MSLESSGRAEFTTSSGAEGVSGAWSGAPSQAARPASESTLLRLDARLMDQLVRINVRVNAELAPFGDCQAFSTEDLWMLPPKGDEGRGGCKPYALEKKQALIGAGVPSAALSLAVGRTSWGELHTVLLVATDRGEMMLDSLSSTVLCWRNADYAWLERQKPGEPATWLAV